MGTQGGCGGDGVPPAVVGPWCGTALQRYLHLLRNLHLRFDLTNFLWTSQAGRILPAKFLSLGSISYFRYDSLMIQRLPRGHPTSGLTRRRHWHDPGDGSPRIVGQAPNLVQTSLVSVNLCTLFWKHWSGETSKSLSEVHPPKSFPPKGSPPASAFRQACAFFARVPPFVATWSSKIYFQPLFRRLPRACAGMCLIFMFFGAFSADFG